MNTFASYFSSQEQALIENLRESKIQCVWFVYPTSEEQFQKYFPEERLGIRAAGLMEFKYVGFYSSGSIGACTAIVAMTCFPTTLSRLELVSLMKKIQAFALGVGARGVALAGLLPSLFHRYGISIDSPCVDGNLGTIYAIVQTLEKAMQSCEVPEDNWFNTPIKILGYGFIGQRCLQELIRLHYRNLVVVERSLRGTYERNFRIGESRRRLSVQVTNNPNIINPGDWVVFVAGGGGDVNVESFQGIYGINDMYPPFAAEQMAILNSHGNSMFEVSLATHGVESTLVIEQFDQDQFPGCMGQGLVEATGVSTSAMTQAEFSAAAWNLGIRSGLKT